MVHLPSCTCFFTFVLPCTTKPVLFFRDLKKPSKSRLEDGFGRYYVRQGFFYEMTVDSGTLRGSLRTQELLSTGVIRTFSVNVNIYCLPFEICVDVFHRSLTGRQSSDLNLRYVRPTHFLHLRFSQKGGNYSR